VEDISGVKRVLGVSALWAWGVSIVLHAVILCVFGVVRFSRAVEQGQYREAPAARIENAGKLTRAAPLMPKPSISKAPAVIARNRYAEATEQSLPLDRIFSPPKPILQDWQPPITADSSLLPATGEFSGSIEFFTSDQRQRKVCYLVDCSGSMQGIFSQVRRKLEESIKALQPDQYFYIIFFGDDKLYEIGSGKMLRATPEAKSEAVEFVDKMRPVGQTNAVAALERAVRIRDGKGRSPSLTYFLTDGFELAKEDAEAFALRIEKLMEQFAPTMKINTIAFLPQTEDRKMLESIARKTGGTFLSIGGE
jgi:hypothetical protein